MSALLFFASSFKSLGGHQLLFYFRVMFVPLDISIKNKGEAFLCFITNLFCQKTQTNISSHLAVFFILAGEEQMKNADTPRLPPTQTLNPKP